MDTITDLHETLIQRISEQNQHTIASFRCLLRYRNKRKYTFRDIRSLLGHRDLTDSVCESVSLEWVVLVSLPISEVPQKQIISLSFQTDRDGLQRRSFIKYSDSRLMEIPSSASTGIIEFEIKSSSRTFANDISSIFENKVKSTRIVQKTPNWLYGKWFGWVKFFVGFFIFSSINIFYSIVLTPIFFGKEDISESGLSLPTISYAIVITVFVLMISAALSAIIIELITDELKKPTPSRIHFNKEEKERWESILSKNEASIIIPIAALAGTLAISVLANLISAGVLPFLGVP